MNLQLLSQLATIGAPVVALLAVLLSFALNQWAAADLSGKAWWQNMLGLVAVLTLYAVSFGLLYYKKHFAGFCIFTIAFVWSSWIVFAKIDPISQIGIVMYVGCGCLYTLVAATFVSGLLVQKLVELIVHLRDRISELECHVLETAKMHGKIIASQEKQVSVLGILSSAERQNQQ